MVKCKVCKKQFKDIDFLVSHIEKEHSSLIPSDYTPARYEYYLRTGKLHGNCVVCKDKTNWNETTNKYHRFCSNPKCKDEYREEFKKRMIGKHGKVHLLNDPDQQRKMLANRSISGEYEWCDGSITIPYVGSYELDFLRMLDLFMNLSGEDILGPSPHTYYYEYKGEKKFYIPDFYIPSLNLEIEIKDGEGETGVGAGENKHPKIQAVDKVKEKNKDVVMESNKDITYIKIVNKEYRQFFELFLRLREKDNTIDPKRTIPVTPVSEGILINHGLDLYVPKPHKFTTPVINYSKTTKEIHQRVRKAKLKELEPIEGDVDSIIAYLDKVIDSSPTSEEHRMVDEAKKEKEFLNSVVKPEIEKRKAQRKMIENVKESYIPEEIILENKLEDNTNVYKPIYILLSFTGTSFSKLIRGVTHQPYSHSSIGFDASLRELYSFGRKDAGDKMHFIEENIHTGLLSTVADTTKYSLYVFMATDKQYNAIKKTLEKMKSEASKYKYNSLGIVTNFFGITTESEYSYFCSEFIADLLKKADENLVYKHPSLFTPSDLRKLPHTFFIKRGTLGKYNAKDTEKIVKEKMLERGLTDVN